MRPKHTLETNFKQIKMNTLKTLNHSICFFLLLVIGLPSLEAQSLTADQELQKEKSMVTI